MRGLLSWQTFTTLRATLQSHRVAQAIKHPTMKAEPTRQGSPQDRPADEAAETMNQTPDQLSDSAEQQPDMLIHVLLWILIGGLLLLAYKYGP